MGCGIRLYQFLIIAFVSTFQVSRFGSTRGNFSDIVTLGHDTLDNLLIKGWGPAWESPSYPPSRGAFAAYTRDNVTEYINFAVEQVTFIPNWFKKEAHRFSFLRLEMKRIKSKLIKFFGLFTGLLLQQIKANFQSCVNVLDKMTILLELG